MVDDVVVIDRSGVPLFSILGQFALPKIRPYYVDLISTYLKNATEEYYKRNKIEGCTNPNAPNFYYKVFFMIFSTKYFKANVDDDTCGKPYNNYTFGGLYQTCRMEPGAGSWVSAADIAYRCGEWEQKNGDTNDFSCGPDYQAVQLLRIRHHPADRIENHPFTECM